MEIFDRRRTTVEATGPKATAALRKHASTRTQINSRAMVRGSEVRKRGRMTHQTKNGGLGQSSDHN